MFEKNRNMSSFEWKGVFPALLTPFDDKDQVDLAMYEKNLTAQVDAGVSGIIIGGSLGEASTITVEEKEQLIKFSVAHLGGNIPVIMNIAEGSTREAKRQASLARSWGASGLMLLPPMRYKSDDRETVTFFMDVAKSTELPIMIYNNPVDYKIEVTLDMFAELSTLPHINAIKESTRDVSNVTRLKNRFGDRFADGLVAGLVDAFPKETVVLYNLVKSGKMEEAIQLYRWFMPLLELDIHPKLVQYIKLAAAQTRIGSEHVRAPRLPLVGEERQRILHVIQTALANRPQL
jgi:dihydrodipicolinate synthase/N-acetylneuraminate lyase